MAGKTVQISSKPWPQGNGKTPAKNPATKHDSTKHHAKPTIK